MVDEDRKICICSLHDQMSPNIFPMENILRHDSWEADISKLRLSDGSIYFINTASHQCIFAYVCIRLHLFALERYVYRCTCLFMFTSFFKNPTSNYLLVHVFIPV